MDPINRRRFLASLGRTGALLAAGSYLDLIGYAQVARGPVRAVIQPFRTRADYESYLTRIAQYPRLNDQALLFH